MRHIGQDGRNRAVGGNRNGARLVGTQFYREATMRRAYPILHLLMIAAMLFAAIAMADDTSPVAGSLAFPPDEESRGLDIAEL